jgi:type I restriction enzyme S subunit
MERAVSDRFERKNWRRARFGDFADSIGERVEPSEADTDTYVGLEHLESECLHIKRWGTPADVEGTKLKFRKGDIIFGRRRAYQRKLAVAEFDGICSAHAMVVRAKPEQVLPEFLPFLMMSDRFMKRAVEISVGSLSPTINWKTLREEEFLLPPLDDQRRIAEILWAADEVVGRNADVNARVEQYRASLFEELILDIKKGYARIACQKLLVGKPRNGLSPKTNGSGIGYPTLSISAVRNGKVTTDGNLKYAEVGENEVKGFLLARGDILVVRGNGNKDLCGRCGVVGDYPDKCFYPDLLIRLTFDREKILPEFAAEQWNEPSTHMRLLRRAKSTNGIWKVNGRDISEHELTVPPVHVQEQVMMRLKRIADLAAAASLHVTSAFAMRTKLVNELLK